MFKLKEYHMIEFYISYIFSKLKLKNENLEILIYKPFINNSKI